ncbi:hypothetical protein [Fibrella aquatica]|jgi:hypothetical protein|uniref:hypothetical protein n=1 Tax=Fibrella aquatica TaxID=3242487 RepID=UPI003522558E
MGKRASIARQWLNGPGSLLAAWLLVFLPIWNASANPPAQQKAYISYDTPSGPVNHQDLATLAGSHSPMALVSQRGDFAFGPSLSILPYTLPDFRWRINFVQLAGHLYASLYPSRFRQLIFEHQIAINAP